MAELESFLIRTNRGPFPGTRVVTEDLMPWPLPDTLDDPESRGIYKKTNESQLPPLDNLNVMRGAEYEWEAN